VSVRIGLTLPSFVEDPEIPLAVARAAEAAGLDGVFVFDHVFRGSGPRARPALECLALLGAVASETSEIAIGTLVARATLRPAATLSAALATAMRISTGRLIATLGSGDSESRPENEAYGLGHGALDQRVRALDQAVTACRGRGFPVWVGGAHPRVREIAVRADGWNRWGGDATSFAIEASSVRAASHAPLTISWGGLVVVGSTEAEAVEKRERFRIAPGTIVGGPEQAADALRELVRGGADWVILGPVDSSDPENAHIIADGVKPLISA
jgi:alkanesulfonate monooxygenase SsuD/methylene tetrahydromethanopterin reductase-like flavin-dependent oxidoreductase (luciferase family)